MDESATFAMKGKVVLRRIGADCLLVPVSGEAAHANCVFPVNETGEFLWSRLAEGRTLGAAAAGLAAAFEVELDSALADARAFAAELLEMGLLERIGT